MFASILPILEGIGHIALGLLLAPHVITALIVCLILLFSLPLVTGDLPTRALKALLKIAALANAIAALALFFGAEAVFPLLPTFLIILVGGWFGLYVGYRRSRKDNATSSAAVVPTVATTTTTPQTDSPSSATPTT